MLKGSIYKLKMNLTPIPHSQERLDVDQSPAWAGPARVVPARPFTGGPGLHWRPWGGSEPGTGLEFRPV